MSRSDRGQISVSAEVALSTATPEQIDLRGPISGLEVSIDRNLKISRGSDDLEIGPRVDLEACSISIEAGALTFSRRTQEVDTKMDTDLDVSLKAVESISLPNLIVGRAPSDRNFKIHVPRDIPLRHPWISYRIESDTELPNVDQRVVRLLNKLMSLTRNHGHPGDRAVFIKKWQGRQGLPVEKFNEAVRVLERHGVIYSNGDMVYVSKNWEAHRYNGKAVGGQRSLNEVLDVWRPLLVEITEAVL